MKKATISFEPMNNITSTKEAMEIISELKTIKKSLNTNTKVSMSCKCLDEQVPINIQNDDIKPQYILHYGTVFELNRIEFNTEQNQCNVEFNSHSTVSETIQIIRQLPDKIEDLQSEIEMKYANNERTIVGIVKI